MTAIINYKMKRRKMVLTEEDYNREVLVGRWSDFSIETEHIKYIYSSSREQPKLISYYYIIIAVYTESTIWKFLPITKPFSMRRRLDRGRILCVLLAGEFLLTWM